MLNDFAILERTFRRHHVLAMFAKNARLGLRLPSMEKPNAHLEVNLTDELDRFVLG